MKCGEKWSREHKCRSGQAYVLLNEGPSDNEDCGYDESYSQGFEQERAESSENQEEAELSLNALSGIQKPTSM